MSTADREYFRRAFELAYFIHPNMEIALRVAEAAVCKLEITFGKQGRRFQYVPAGRRQSSGLSPHALRTKVSLREEHLLQLLVYAESDSWERGSECGTSPYPLTDEDMVIRFIKHLIQITLKRNSFYVTLGLGRLLYEYETSQVRQMYDVLMQDHARFRDNSYLRKQKKVVMREMLERFDQMIRTVRTAQGEDRFLSQPTTDLLVSLVHECLVRFTPWDTSCVIPEGFDPLARIPALAFSGTDPDNESPIEMNRIHAIVDPDCFSRLVASLGFAPPNERLAAPRFFYSDGNLPRGDRLNPPPLSEEHRLRLKRAREDSARRRKTYRVGQLRIYIDDIESMSFDPRRMTTVEFKLPVAAKMIEVIGQDEQGDLPLATLLVAYGDIPSEGSLSDSLTLEGGQQLTIVLTPVGTATGEIEQVEVELGYAETQPLRALSWLTQRALFGLAEVVGIRRKESEELKIDYSWFVKAAIALALMLGVLMIIWRQLRPTQRDFSVPPRQVELMPTPATELSPTPPPVQTPVRPQNQRTPAAQIARVAWNKDPHAVDNAIRLEVRRGGVPNVEISNTTTTLLLAVNNADSDERPYHRYRLILTAAEKSIWERILQAPKVTSGSHAYVLTLEFSPERFPKADSYRLQIEGETQAGWQSVGQLILNPVTH